MANKSSEEKGMSYVNKNQKYSFQAAQDESHQDYHEKSKQGFNLVNSLEMMHVSQG